MKLMWKICLVFLGLLIGTAFMQAQDTAYPKNGDGITVFLNRHNRPGEVYKKQFIELNKNKLGKGNQLLLGVKYTLPPLQNKQNTATGKSGTSAKPVQNKKSATTTGTTAGTAQKRPGYEPLFGKEYASYTVNSNELKGACFYLVSGHGGPDPGAIGKLNGHELHEDEYAYDIVLRLARNLMMRGAKVHIIIQDPKDGIRNSKYLNNSKNETCMGSPIPLNQIERLDQRCNKINSMARNDKEAYKRAIFVHIDSRSKKHQTDVYFYHHETNPTSKQLAQTMKQTFTDKYRQHQPGRGFSGTVSGRNLHVLRKTTTPAVFVELGNLQNSYDQQRFILSNNRQALANWMCEGFVNDYKRFQKKKK